MYLVHLIILVFFIILMMTTLMVKLPVGFKKEGLYTIPFYKLAAGILRIRNWRYLQAGTEIKKQLVMLNPAGDAEELKEEYEIKRLGKMLLVVFIGNILALLICLTSDSKSPIKEGRIIERNTYGQGEKSINISILADGEPVLENHSLVISERKYTQEEIEQMFDEINLCLEQEILGQNESLDYVCYDLELMDKMKDYPVAIEWELSNYLIISSDGKINKKETVPEGTVVEFTAILSYYDFQGEHRFNAVIYPPPLTEEESFKEKLLSVIEDYETQTQSYSESYLPTEVEGKNITYKTPDSETNLLLLGMTLLVAVIIFKATEQDLMKEITKRNTQMMMDYPQIISKLTLLLGAGMTIQGAFKKIATDYEKRRKITGYRYAYEEMLLCVRQIKGGISEGDAYVRFGNRCMVQKYVKLGALLSQNLKKGSTGILELLESEERDAFEERKSLARKLGEEAGTKLLAPMGIMLVIVMIIVVIPAFLSFKA